MSDVDDVDDLLEDAEAIEVTEEGKIVPRGSGEKKPGKGVQLPQHTFYN